MSNNVSEIEALIRDAFRDVTLGDGIGLYEARGMDDYADPRRLAKLRVADEKEDWQSISARALNDCAVSLSFFDEAGMRFHLPAFLIASLQLDEDATVDFDLFFHLIEAMDPRAECSFLTVDQKYAVRQFLLLFDPDITSDRHALAHGLATRWRTDRPDIEATK